MLSLPLLAALLVPPDSLPPPGPAHRLAYTYANDLFFGTDYYFTQGMTLDVVSPALVRLPTHRLLLPGPAGSARYHGVLLRYDGFTPLRIQDAFIRVGDRPYAAYFYASFYQVCWQGPAGQRLTSALDLGYLGPAAGGKLIQTKLHELTHNAEPRGWDYQIRSDAVLGYNLSYERRLLAAGRWLELAGRADASLGTLYTYAGVGGRLRLGWFNSYFTSLEGAGAGHRWQLYAEATFTGRLVGYDATLQGGFFNRHSPYTLSFSEVSHAVPHGTASLVLARGGLSFTATAVAVGPECAGGRAHGWGVLALARTW